jgi:hypothetical protein
MAYRIGLDLVKSNFDEAKSTIDFVLREEQIERTATLTAFGNGCLFGRRD